MERSRSLIQRVVVFDLGEVLASPTDLFAQLAKVLGSDAARVEDAYWSRRDEHDLGSTADEYWRPLVAEITGTPADEGLVALLARLDSELWTTIKPDVRELLQELRDGGERIALLSNAPAGLGTVARDASWADLIDEWFFSGELRIAKPDPLIYETVATRLQVEPGQIVFFDDRESNVDAARHAGWDAHLWVSATAARETLLGVRIA